MRVLAIVPAYNEEECLANTVRELTETCPDVDYLVVNDGSSDATPRICDELALNHIDLPVNCGLTSAVKAGMKYALRHGYDAAIQIDSDGQHMPEYIPVMAKAMESEGADVVIASRNLAGGQGRGGPCQDARAPGRHELPALHVLDCLHGAHVPLDPALPVV